jgi:ribosomal protein S18 acetylase RimI-like enzyme
VNVILKPFETNDLDALLAVVNTYYLEPVTAEAWLTENNGELEDGTMLRQTVAVMAEEGGGERIAGYSTVRREYGTWDPRRMQVWAITDPQLRGRGLGDQLYCDALAWASGQGAYKLDSMVRDDDPTSLAFAERRGFKIDRHMYSSRLDLSHFSEEPFRGLIERVEAGGVRLFTMEDEGDRPEAQRKLYELNKYVDSRIPGERLFPSFEEFSEMVFRSGWYMPDAQVVAADGERWIGITAGGVFAPDTMTMTMTGVHEEYGGRGIGTALKLLLVRTAQKHDIRYMLAGNDSHNVPMLRVNEKLGFKPLRGTYYVQLLLDGGSET